MKGQQKINVFLPGISLLLLELIIIPLCSSAKASMEHHYSTETDSSKITECSKATPYEGKEMECELHVPPFVKVYCMQWDMAKIYVDDEDKYSKLSYTLLHLVIECQSGTSFFLNTTALNWDKNYKVNQEKVLAAKSKNAGTFERHSFKIEITVANVSNLGSGESYKFYKQNAGKVKHFSFNIAVINKSMDEIAPRTPSGLDSKTNPSIEFHKNSAKCTLNSTKTDDLIQELINVQFLQPSLTQRFLECFRRSDLEESKDLSTIIKDCTTNKDTVKSCTQTSCEKLSDDTLMMNDIHISGVIICSTNDNRKEIVEYFTTLDGVKYPYDKSLELSMSKLAQVRFVNESAKYFYTNQNLILKYKIVSYRDTDTPMYWEYRFSDGHYHSLIPNEDVVVGKKEIALTLKKNVVQIFYFIPWTPFPVGSVINVKVSDPKQPGFYMKKNYMEVEKPANGQLELYCDFRGNPAPKLTWLKDNKIISNSDKNFEIKSSYFEDQAVSILRLFRPEHVGKYECKANNNFGRNDAKWNVTHPGIGYEGMVLIVMLFVGIALIGVICYQIWFPPQNTAKTIVDEL